MVGYKLNIEEADVVDIFSWSCVCIVEWLFGSISAHDGECGG